MAARTTTDLVADVRARVSAPDSASDGIVQDADLVDLLDEELRGELAGIVISTRSQYWLTSYSIALTAGVASYRLPDRALAQTLHDVTLSDSSGREWNVSQANPGEVHRWSGSGRGPDGPASRAFTLRDGSLVMLPTPASAGLTLKMSYYRRPSRLVLASAASAIDYADTTTRLYLASAPPAALQVLGALTDIVRGDGMFEPLFEDVAVEAYNGPDIDLVTPIVVADIATAVTGGRTDYFCEAGTTVYPPIPMELYPLLVSLGCRAYAEAVGDMRALQVAGVMVDRRRKTALSIMMPRVDAETPRSVSHGTLLRSGGRGAWGGWR